MPIPSGVETVTVTSGVPLTLPDGTLYRGHIRFIAPDLAVVPSDDYTLGGEAVAELTNGEFSITLVPQDATGIAPTGWTYTIIGEFVNAPGWTRYSVLSKDEPNVILSDILDATSLEPALTSSSVFRTEAVKHMGLDTGMLWGGSIDQAITPGVIVLNAGAGIVVDYSDNDATPTISLVNISAQNVTIANLSAPITWLMASSAGTIVQQTTTPTNAQRRTHIQIGAVATSGGAIIVDQSIPTILANPVNQLYDLMDSLGSFNVSGNDFFAAGTNLQLAKNGGEVFVRGFNHFAGLALTNDPHVSVTAAQNPVSIRYVTRTSTPTGLIVTSVDPANYDVGGVVTAIGGTGTRSTIQRVYLFPTNNTQDQVIIQYGQNFYSTIDAAVAAIPTDTFVQNPNIRTGVLLGYLVMTRTATNLSNTTHARLFMSSKFQGGFATANAALNLALLLTGGTMTGPLILSADPVASLEAVTKQYVDALSLNIPFAEARIVDHDLSDMASAPSWAIVSTSGGTQLKCSINAAVGDRIKVCPNFMFQGPHFMDWTILGPTGLPDRYDASRSTTPPAEGAPSMYPSTSFPHVNTDVSFTVAANNIVAGQATIALANQGTGSGFKVYAHPTYPWVLRLENWGPEPA